LIITWLFFKDNQNVKRQQINISLFEKKQKNNIQFLNYLSGKDSWNAQQSSTDINLSLLKSKALFTAVLSKVKQGKTLQKLDEHTGGIIILSMKSLIEAFEEVYKIK
jgi:hypothetical protein